LYRSVSGYINTFFLVFISVLFLFGCKTIEPQSPQSNLLEPIISQPKMSMLNIPVEVKLESYFGQVNNSIPTKFVGGESACEGLSYQYELNREDILFNTQSFGIDFSTTINYKLNLNYCLKCTDLINDNGNCVVPRIFGSCGNNEPLRKADISLSSTIDFEPNYKLKSKTNLKKLTLIDPCKITLLNYDITSILDKEIRKEAKEIESEIDKQISSIDIKSTCKHLWNEIQNEIPIGSYGYLNLSPNAISLSQLSFEKNNLFFNVGVELYPSLKTEKSTVNLKSLPNLTNYKSKDGFEMNVDLDLSYDSITSWVGKEINRTNFIIQNRKIIIDSVKFIGADGSRILIGLNFYGFRKGKLFLSAQPVLDPEKQVLRLVNVQFDLKTKDLLMKTANWLLDDQISRKIEEKSIFDINHYLNKAKQEISKALNQELENGIYLLGEIEKIHLNELYPLKKALFIRSTLFGKLKLKIG